MVPLLERDLLLAQTDNGWVESNPASFPSLDSYYDSVDMRRPDLVSVSSSSEPTT